MHSAKLGLGEACISVAKLARPARQLPTRISRGGLGCRFGNRGGVSRKRLVDLLTVLDRLLLPLAHMWPKRQCESFGEHGFVIHVATMHSISISLHKLRMASGMSITS